MAFYLVHNRWTNNYLYCKIIGCSNISCFVWRMIADWFGVRYGRSQQCFGYQKWVGFLIYYLLSSHHHLQNKEEGIDIRKRSWKSSSTSKIIQATSVLTSISSEHINSRGLHFFLFGLLFFGFRSSSITTLGKTLIRKRMMSEILLCCELHIDTQIFTASKASHWLTRRRHRRRR